jgi:hypothetical protein
VDRGDHDHFPTDTARPRAPALFGLDVNRHSGHFLPSAASLQTGVDKFAEKGVQFAPGSIDCTIG